MCQLAESEILKPICTADSKAVPETHMGTRCAGSKAASPEHCDNVSEVLLRLRVGRTSKNHWKEEDWERGEGWERE